MHIDPREACRRLVEVQSVLFGYRKSCNRLVDLRKVRFDIHKACNSLAEVENAFCPLESLLETWRVGFYHLKSCWRLAEHRESFSPPQWV